MRRLLPLLAGACTILTPEAFAPERRAAVCAVEAACFGTHASEQDCLDALGEPDEPACEDFDLGAANDCVRVLRHHAWECPTTDRALWQVPATCAEACALTPVSE